MHINNKRAIGLSLLLGALAACGFAPLELWPLTLASFAAWIALVHAAPSFRAALIRGYAFGVGHFTVNNNWFQHAFDFQDAMPPVLGYFAAVALALYLAVYPMAAAGIAWRFRHNKPDGPFILIFAAAWIATEYLRAVLFTGYAWNPLGVIWVPVELVAGLSAWVGTYALSGLTIALAGSLLLNPRRPLPVAGAAAAILALLGLQVLSYQRFASPAARPSTPPRVRIVQPNIGQQDRGQDDSERVLQALLRRSGTPGPASRLVVWPEGVVRDLVEDGYPPWLYQRPPESLRRRIASVLGPKDLLLFGGTALTFTAEDEIDKATNAVFALDARARLTGRYDKAHLVPYGEYLPVPWLLKPLGLARIVPGDLDFTPGPGPRNLATPFGQAGIQTCYEIIFSGEVVDRAHRPAFLFNPSNDAWFGRWGPPQHLAQARMRAIEEGLPIIRATPTGISAVIAANGALLARIPHETAGAVEVPIPEPLPPTLFSRAGNLMAAIVAVLLFGVGVAIRRRRR